MEDMSERSHDGAETDVEDADLKHKSSMCGLDNSSVKLDHCDLLLDSIDAQLGRLQPPKQQREHDCSVTAHFKWSHSVSKDTGHGSTTQTKDSPMSCLDLVHVPFVKHPSERSSSSQNATVVNEETKVTSNRKTRDKAEIETRTEQVIWRLERLLGDTCREGVFPGEVQPLSDSICTEDFLRCFSEEMVDPALSESNMIQLDSEEKAEEPVMLDSETCLSVSYGTSHFSDKPGARERNKLPQRTDDNTKTHRCSYWNAQKDKAQHSKKETFRLKYSSGDNDKYTDERVNLWNQGYTTDWHALQELQWLAADTAPMDEKEQQRASFVLDVGNTEPKLGSLHQRKQAQTAASSMTGNSIIISVLEKEELERQLDKAKIELFAEQRRARKELELMQEKLEETCELLQTATQAEISLRNECVCLEDKQMQKMKQMEALETRVRELQVELGERKVRLESLEKLLVQKEQQLTELHKQSGTLQSEKDGLKVELHHLKTTYYRALKEAQEQVHRVTVNQQTQEVELRALKEQNTSLTQHIKSMQSSLQLKEEEAMQLKTSLEQQREESKNHEKQLHEEALEKAQKAIEEERRKWEAEEVEAVQVHCRILEEQNRKNLENMRSKIQREKNEELAAWTKLKTKVQDLERERFAQQREHESLLAGIKSLKEEHQAELQRLQKQMAQESQKNVRLQQAAQLAEKEAGRVQVMLEERDSSHDKLTAELHQQLRTWAQDLGAECQHLNHLLEQCGDKQNTLHLPPSPSVAEGLVHLRSLREQLKHSISHLQTEVDLQKQTSQQLKLDKERELNIQRLQLRVERDQALGFLKEQLIQEHMEELSELKWLHMSDDVAHGRVAQSLQKQFRSKDLELRQVQKNMDALKDQAAAHLVELQREASDVYQEIEKLPVGAKANTSFRSKRAPASLHTMDCAASCSPSEMASFKLLSYLQRRVQQLRVENQTHTFNPSPPESHSATSQGHDSAARHQSAPCKVKDVKPHSVHVT